MSIAAASLDDRAMTLARIIAERSIYLAEVHRNLAKGSKAWKFKIQVFNDPDVKCCYCQEMVRTNRIWFVDSENFLVKKVYRKAFRDSVRILEPVRELWHPHVNTDGNICFGNVDASPSAVGQVLWMGLNPNSAYHGVKEWLRELGHRCDAMSRARRRDEDSEDYELCFECGDEITRDDSYWVALTSHYYCEGCYEERFFNCVECNNDFRHDSMVSGPEGSPYCQDCYDERYRLCDECEGVFRRINLIITDDDRWLCTSCNEEENSQEEEEEY